LNYTWIITGKLAISPMPSRRDIERLASTFDCVVVLASKSELKYDLSLWKKFDVEYIYHPIPNYSAPHLINLIKLMEWIEGRIASELKVLVHCVGGLGRSGTIAASYLVYGENYRWIRAINYVRERRKGAIETLGQEAIIRALNLTLNCMSKTALNKVISIGGKYGFGRRLEHSSKVLQLAITLWSYLKSNLKLTTSSGTALIIAAILHDVGKALSGKEHHYWTSKVIEDHFEELAENISEKALLKAKFTAYHHEAGDPRENEDIPSEIRSEVVKLTSILRLADALDETLNQAVETVKCDRKRGELTIQVILKENAKQLREVVIERVLSKISLLKELLDEQVKVLVI